MIVQLGKRYEFKFTGRPQPCQAGYLQFLGREIRGEAAGGNLSLALSPAYFDGIEEASGWSLRHLSRYRPCTRMM